MLIQKDRFIKVHSRVFSKEYNALYEDLSSHRDILDKVKPIVPLKSGQLDNEERTALISAYKHIYNGLLSHLQLSQGTEGAAKYSTAVQEINRICNEVLELLQKWLIPAASTGEECVFYWKTLADFHRYLYHLPSDKSVSDEHANASFQGYKLAYDHASEHLVPSNQTRLGLSLNFSIFYFDVFNSPERACHVAKFAFDEAVDYAGKHPGDVSDESLGVLQILQDNLMFWLKSMP